jgi:hypothetical protein
MMCVIYETRAGFYVKAEYDEKGELLKKSFYLHFDSKKKALIGFLFFVLNPLPVVLTNPSIPKKSII